MAELFASGRIIDLILLLVVVEGIVFFFYRQRTGRGPATADLLSTLLAGGCLLLALRSALTGAAWGWIALCLVAALLAHISDIWGRWR